MSKVWNNFNKSMWIEVLVKKYNKNTIVKGEIRYAARAIAILSVVFPLTISVNTGETVPGGIEVSSKTPIAISGLNRRTIKKRSAGMRSK